MIDRRYEINNDTDYIQFASSGSDDDLPDSTDCARVGTIVGVNEIKRNYIEAVKWRSEALAQSLVSTLHHRALLSADDRDVSREFSTECRQLFRLYKMQRVTHIAIIDTAGTIVAHNDQRVKDRPISPVLRRAAKISETTIILDQDISYLCTD